MEDKLKVFFSGTFGESTFEFNWDNEDEVREALLKDYRLAVLEDVDKLFKHSKELVINHDLDIIYTGPFWCEHDSLGNHTTTDCMAMMKSEIDEIDNSDVVICVLSNKPSTGSCGEIMHAINSCKQCHIFYQYHDNLGDLSIKARHWWIVAYAMHYKQLGYPIEITMYYDIDEVKNKLSSSKFYEKWKDKVYVR